MGDLETLKKYVFDEIKRVKDLIEYREKRDAEEIKREVLKTDSNNEFDIGYILALEDIVRKIQNLINKE